MEVLNASEQLEALTRRTYEVLEAKGLRLTPAVPLDMAQQQEGTCQELD